MRVVLVLLAIAADLAWNLAGAFWGFTLLAVLVLWVALNQASIATGSKAYRTEQRLNAAIARLPVQQTSPGTYSSGISGSTDGIGQPDGGSVSTQQGSGTAHWHNLTGTGAGHGHYYGNIAGDLNGAIAALNTTITKLQQANILN